MELSLKNMEEQFLTKNEFIKELSMRTNINQITIKYIFENMVQIIAEQLSKGFSVDVPKIGKFYISKKKSHMGYDVVSGNISMLDTCVYPMCKIGSTLKNRLKSMKNFGKSSEIDFS